QRVVLNLPVAQHLVDYYIKCNNRSKSKDFTLAFVCKANSACSPKKLFRSLNPCVTLMTGSSSRDIEGSWASVGQKPE
ncbi:MAG: hypothetical protein ACE5PV_19715, partial [Candidatus Poribacteria bacterium]